MNKETLQQISGLLAQARNILDEMDVTEWDEDIKANWLDEIETVEGEVDTVIEGMR